MASAACGTDAYFYYKIVIVVSMLVLLFSLLLENPPSGLFYIQYALSSELRVNTILNQDSADICIRKTWQRGTIKEAPSGHSCSLLCRLRH